MELTELNLAQRWITFHFEALGPISRFQVTTSLSMILRRGLGRSWVT